MRQALSLTEIESRLKSHKNWQFKDSSLYRDIQFKDFTEAFSFMTKVAAISEAMDHHPDWSNVYNRVSIRLNTHDAKGITDLDFELAKKIDALLG